MAVAACSVPQQAGNDRSPFLQSDTEDPQSIPRYRASMGAVDYDAIASSYDRRYALHTYPGVEAAIRARLEERRRVLEVGCGTGHWLRLLAAAGCEVAGVDSSAPMLAEAAQKVAAELRLGAAEQLPWPDESFDLVLYVNALHHFREAIAAVREALRVLRPGGKVLSIGLDPHEGGERWYVYDFFPGARALDLARFPSREQRFDLFRRGGFENVVVEIAERLSLSLSLEQARRDGVLQRTFTSQLTALPDEQYEEGLRRIGAAAATDASFRLEVDLPLYLTEASRPVS